MNREEMFEAIAEIDETKIKAAREYVPGKKKAGSHRWGVLAACVCLVIGLSAVGINYLVNSGAGSNPGDVAPFVVVHGTAYIISVRGANYPACPDGFSYAGEIGEGDYEGIAYYVNPELPEHIYLYMDCYADGTMEYLRFVNAEIRGDNYVSYNGQLYLYYGSAQTYGDDPDVADEVYDAVRERFGLRMEGEPPEGFEFVGTAEFEGYEIIPTGELGCNTEAWERNVWANPEDDAIILVSTAWHKSEGNLSVRHTGFNVYFKIESE